MSDAVSQVFVYGTLMPGQLRWGMLAPWCMGEPVEDSVPGALFRTPYGWPAAVFDAAVPTSVPGVRIRIIPEKIDSALDALDVIEGTRASLFTRVLVTTTQGADVWSYTWMHGTDGFERISAWVSAEAR